MDFRWFFWQKGQINGISRSKLTLCSAGNTANLVHLLETWRGKFLVGLRLLHRCCLYQVLSFSEAAHEEVPVVVSNSLWAMVAVSEAKNGYSIIFGPQVYVKCPINILENMFSEFLI